MASSAPIISAFRSMMSPRRKSASRRTAANSSSTSATNVTAISNASSRIRTASFSIFPKTAGRARTATRSNAISASASQDDDLPALLLHELIGIEIVDRRLLLDDALGEIEVLQLGQPVGVDRAENLLARINQL